MKLSEALALFLRARAARLSPASQGHYTAAIKRLVSVIGDVPLTDVRPEMLWDFLADLTSQKTRWRNLKNRPSAPGGLSDYTIDRTVQTVRAFFKWFVKAEYLSASPAVLLEYKKPEEQEPKRISEDQVRALLAAATHPRDYALIRFAVVTGARRGGLQGMEVEHLDLAERSATLKEKGNKKRKVFFDEGTRDALMRWLRVRPQGTTALWAKDDGEPLTLAGLRQVLLRLCRKAKIPNVSLHQLRHTFAYTAIKQGVLPEYVRQQMGHEDIEMTMHYVRLVDKDRQEAFSQSLYPDIDRKPSRQMFKRVK